MSNPLQVASNVLSSAALTASFASLPAAGNSVIVALHVRGNNTLNSVSDNQSNVYSKIDGFNNSIERTEIWWCPSIGTPSGTFTVTIGTSSSLPTAVGIMECSGLTAVDKHNNANSAGTSGSVTNGAANTGANDFVVAALCIGGSFGSATSLTTPPNSGYTSWYFFDGTSAFQNGVSAGYKTVSAVETSSASWTWTATDSANWAAVVASFQTGPLPTGPMPRQIYLMP